MAVEGAFPIKALPLHVGIRRPLGVSAGGLAILAAMDDHRAADVVRSNLPRYPADGGIDEDHLLHAIRLSRVQGWAMVANKATPGMTAIGSAIFNADNEPVGAISISAISLRMVGERQQVLARLLMRYCAEVTEVLAQRRQAGKSTGETAA
jgi:DNA-binding IclR family transcriptional regulator